MDSSSQSVITWNCCANNGEPDWSIYDALELAGCVEEDGNVERVEEDTISSFYTVYGHLLGGGCEALHDWPTGFLDIKVIRGVCAVLGERLEFTGLGYGIALQNNACCCAMCNIELT